VGGADVMASPNRMEVNGRTGGVRSSGRPLCFPSRKVVGPVVVAAETVLVTPILYRTHVFLRRPAGLGTARFGTAGWPGWGQPGSALLAGRAGDSPGSALLAGRAGDSPGSALPAGRAGDSPVRHEERVEVGSTEMVEVDSARKDKLRRARRPRCRLAGGTCPTRLSFQKTNTAQKTVDVGGRMPR